MLSAASRPAVRTSAWSSGSPVIPAARFVTRDSPSTSALPSLAAIASSTVDIPTIDVISTERNVVGNLVGSYNDLVELMALNAAGRVTILTQTYPLDAVNDAMDDHDAGRLRGRGILVPTAAGS